MNIIRLIPKLKVGGVESGVLKELAFFSDDNDGHNNVYNLITLESPDANFHKYIKFVLNKGVNAKWYALFSISNFLKKQSFYGNEIVISSLWKSHLACFYYFFRKKRYQVVPFFHSSKSTHFMDFFMTILMAKKSKYILVDSLATESYIRGLVNCEKKYFFKIPFCFFKKNEFMARDIHDEVKFIFVGRISKVKNINFAINFFKLFVDKHPKAIFDIYGPDEGEKQSAVELVKNLGLTNSVFFKGVIMPDLLQDLIRKYDFLLQTSHYEGFAATVVEAMQYGLVPIVTAVGDIPNYSKHGISAFHFSDSEQKNIEIVCEQVLNVVKNAELYTAMSQNAINAATSLGVYEDAFYLAMKTIDGEIHSERI